MSIIGKLMLGICISIALLFLAVCQPPVFVTVIVVCVTALICGIIYTALQNRLEKQGMHAGNRIDWGSIGTVVFCIVLFPIMVLKELLKLNKK